MGEQETITTPPLPPPVLPVPAFQPINPVTAVKEVGQAIESGMSCANSMSPLGMSNTVTMALLIAVVGILGVYTISDALAKRASSQREDMIRADIMRVFTDQQERQREDQDRQWKMHELSSEKTRLMLEKAFNTIDQNNKLINTIQETNTREMRELRDAIKQLSRKLGSQDLIPISPPPNPIPHAQGERAEKVQLSTST